MKKQIALVLAGLLLLTPAAGCASGGSYSQSASSAAEYPAAEAAPNPNTAGYDGEYLRDNSINIRGEAQAEEPADYDDEAEIEEGDAPEESGGNPDAGGGLGGGVTVQDISTDTRKIVITVDLTLQTMEFETGTEQIVALTQAAGGYVQDSYVEGSNMYDKYMSRSASYTVRVPKAKLDNFLAAVADEFNVASQRQSSTDISMQYFDNKARLESLRVQEERLMAMLQEAGELEYLLQVEQELANVLYEIERITSALNRMDDSVDLSTVTIQLQEVVKYEEVPPVRPLTFGERISYTFGDSWEAFLDFCQDVVLFLVALVPFLPVILIIAVVLFIVIRRLRKRHKARVAAMPKPQPYTPIYTIPQPPQPPRDPGPGADTPKEPDEPPGPDDPEKD